MLEFLSKKNYECPEMINPFVKGFVDMQIVLGGQSWDIMYSAFAFFQASNIMTKGDNSFSHLDIVEDKLAKNGSGSFSDSNVSSSQAMMSRVGKRACKTAQRVQKEMLKHSRVVDHQRVDNVIQLECDEVMLGDLLGSGKFCHVIQVHRIECKQTTESPAMTERRSVMSSETRSDKFAIKFLRNDLTPDKYCMAAAELVVEMHFLASISHPNIIKLHGVSREGPLGFQNGNGYFFIIDRLFETLDIRFNVWRAQEKLSNDCSTLMLERLQAAADVSSALSYLHAHKILYRGIDPKNLGFDASGRIVLFDLGLARELDESKLTADGANYELTGNKGNLAYMAPEVGMCQPYGLAADVYGMSILLWQFCTLDPSPFPELNSRDQYLQRVVQNEERPPIDSKWPETLKFLIRSAWTPKSIGRPPMKQFHRNLLHEVNDLQQTMHQHESLGHTESQNYLINALRIPPSPRESSTIAKCQLPKSPTRSPTNSLHPTPNTNNRRPEHQQLALEALEQVEHILEAPLASRRRSFENLRPEHKLLAQEAAKKAPITSSRRVSCEGARPEHKILAHEAAKQAPVKAARRVSFEGARPEHKILAQEAAKQAPAKAARRVSFEGARPEHKILAHEAANRAAPVKASRRFGEGTTSSPVNQIQKLHAMEVAIQLMSTHQGPLPPKFPTIEPFDSKSITVQGQTRRREDPPRTPKNKASAFLLPKRRDIEVMADTAHGQGFLRSGSRNVDRPSRASSPMRRMAHPVVPKVRSPSRTKKSSSSNLPSRDQPTTLPPGHDSYSAIRSSTPTRRKSTASRGFVGKEQYESGVYKNFHMNFTPEGFPSGLMPPPSQAQRRGSGAAA